MTKPRLHIVIPGGSGQIGQILARHFHARGDDVTVLSRNPQAEAPWRVVAWDGRSPGAWIEFLERSDVCVNLSGRSVNCRYTAQNRKDILDSRIVPTLLLNDVIGSMARPPRLWMNASTATIYRHALDRPMDEAGGELGGDEPGAPKKWNFLIEVATKWEEAFFSRPTPHTRKIAIRSAITFNADRGSIFEALSRLARIGLGGRSGSGKQFVSWIHQVDFIHAVEFLIANEALTGVVNISSPNPVPNRDFMRALRRAWGHFIGIPAPAWMIEIGTFLLRTESELVLKSRRVVPGRLLDAGFQ